MKNETVQIITIQKTAKRYKLAKALGGLLLIVTPFYAYAIHANAEIVKGEPSYTGPVITAAVGIILYLYGRIGAWWNNG